MLTLYPNPVSFRVTYFYEYRKRQNDFTFSFTKESLRLQKSLDSLLESNCLEDIKSKANAMRNSFKNHRLHNKDVNNFWNEIELEYNNNEMQRLESDKTLRTKRCHVNINSKTQDMMENMAEETVEQHLAMKSTTKKKKRDQNEEDHEEKTTKRKKIDDYFSPVYETQHDQAQQPCENEKNNKNNEEPPVTGSPDDILKQYHQSDGYTTPSSYSPILQSPILDFDNNPFLEDSIISIDDVPNELTFEYRDQINEFFLGETNVSLLFNNYQNQSLELAKTNGLFVESNVHEILSLSSILLLTPNSHSNIMINIFSSPLLDQIHQEFMPMQQIVLDPKCESTFRKVIKMAMKNSCEDATNWLCGQLANEKILRENAGYTILDCLRTLPMSTIRSDHSEITHITNYLDRIMRGFFDDPNQHIVQWPNTALEESKAGKFEGRAKQPDFTVSVIHQLQTKAVLFVGEVTPPSQKNNVFKNCNDLIRIGVFMKDCLDSAIEKVADVKVLGFQCVDYKVDFYVMDLIKGSYIMIHIGQIIFPASIKEMLPFVDEMEMILKVREIFRESFNLLYTNLCYPSPPSAKAPFKRETLSTPKFRQLVSKTRNVNRFCPFWFGRF
ncbi:hypothetical protein Glove_302g51 [Diversispora epigaea]|uniref:Uncharacterized protein n=1 Tax=Diversispora epigaea TaxID=1348612 RepID=A0A397HYW7_9GLOM|nr:hypothetical protein Glove_302g51 [Diversispora epigaea]